MAAVEVYQATRFVIMRAPSWRVTYTLVTATGEELEDGAEFEAGWWSPAPSTEAFADWIVDNRLDRGGEPVVSEVEMFTDGRAPHIIFHVAIHSEDDEDDDDDDDDP